MADKAIGKVSKVRRRGKSLGFPIPQDGAVQVKLTGGASLNVQVCGDTITISRAKSRKKWTEVELLKGVKPALCGPDLIPDRAGRELF